jgi:hypothetical protein
MKIVNLWLMPRHLGYWRIAHLPMSAFLPKAAIADAMSNVCFVPKAEVNTVRRIG